MRTYSGRDPSRAIAIASKLRRIVAEEAGYPKGFALPSSKQKTILSAAELLETAAVSFSRLAPTGLLSKRLRVDAKTAEREGHPIRAARLSLAAQTIDETPILSPKDSPGISTPIRGGVVL